MITVYVLVVMGAMACFAPAIDRAVTWLGYPLPRDPDGPLPDPESQREKTRR